MISFTCLIRRVPPFDGSKCEAAEFVSSTYAFSSSQVALEDLKPVWSVKGCLADAEAVMSPVETRKPGDLIGRETTDFYEKIVSKYGFLPPALPARQSGSARTRWEMTPSSGCAKAPRSYHGPSVNRWRQRDRNAPFCEL